MLNGTYYFREVFYVIGDNTGDFQDAAALYNTVTFDGNGKYSMNAVLADASAGSLQSGTITGTYSISASGYGFLSNPLSTGDLIFGLVSQSGVFIGSSTESGFNDLFRGRSRLLTRRYQLHFQGHVYSRGYGSERQSL